jgi:DNA modification methylase
VNDRAAYANANATRLPLADKSVHMIATSPPYWGLRSYDTGPNKHAELGAEKLHDCGAWARRSIIGFRGVPEFEEDGDGNAVFVGLPPEPIYGPPAPPCGACYVCNLRTWAAEMWRVLRDDGTLWLNLADSYANNGGPEPVQTIRPVQGASDTQNGGKSRRVGGGLKAKDMAGIPWRVALALQSDGWYLRSDCIWEKPNAMPSSVTDRPSTSHEYIFLLTKRPRYYWDNEAVKEQAAEPTRTRLDKFGGAAHRERGQHSEGGLFTGASTRNLRTVWNIATAPYSGAHFATWPPALVERMVKAGSSEHGVCPTCGAPWRRVVDKGEPVNATRNPNDVQPYPAGNGYNNGNGATTLHKVREVKTVEWRPTCAHADAAPVPAIVLDPFCGSGTTLLVARQLGRIGLGFDLSETYLRDNAAVRLGHDKLAAWGRGIVDTGDYTDLFRAHANSATEAE